MSTRREAFILVSRPPSDAAKVVLPSPGVDDVTAMTRAGRSRLLRLMAVNTARIASAAERGRVVEHLPTHDGAQAGSGP